MQHSSFRRNVLPVFIGILVLSFIAGAQTAPKITVFVRDTNGDGIPGAGVVIKRAGNAAVVTCVADEEGFCRIPILPSDISEIAVSAKGFASASFSTTQPDGSYEVLLTPANIAIDLAVTTTLLAGTPESLDEIPGAISRIDGTTLVSTRAANFSEVLRKVSGVNVRDEEGIGLRPNISIRGTNPTRSTKILLLEDGIPLAYAPYGDNASYYHPPVERYEAIEVLKGSGQIAFGPQTVAGVINYITPQPTERPSLSLRMIGGNRRSFNGSGTASGTIGRTSIFAGFTRKQSDGSRENIDSKANDLTAKAVQRIDDRNVLTFKFSYFGEESNVTYSGLTEAEYAADPRQNPFKNDFFYGGRFGFSTAHTAVVSPSAVLNTTFYFNQFSRDWWRQSSNSGQRPNRLNVDPDCLSMADLNTTCGNEGRMRRYKTYGVEPRFTRSFSMGNSVRGEFQTGLRLHWEKQDRRQENGDLPLSRRGVLVENNFRSNFAFAGFVQQRFVFWRLAITPGVRFERIKVSRTNLLSMPRSFGEAIVTTVIPGVGVAYAGLPRMTIFAGVHKGFSPPRAEDVITNAGGVVELDPEESWNFEAGFRGDPFRGLKIEAAFFRNDYKNQIVPSSVAGAAGAALTNGGRTLQQGFEASAQADSGVWFGSRNNLYVRTAITYLSSAEFRGVRFSSLDPAVAIAGNRIPYTPKFLSTSSLGYSHTKGVDAFIENVFIGSQFGDDLNLSTSVANGQRGPINSQNYWNATANYSVERLRSTFFLTVKNLTGRTNIIDRTRGILPSSPRLIQGGIHIRFSK
ncbi:MAG: TonB-dependent receptor plug domain-containing protein [Acidobacteriota bacterium]|nr:MAG: TonB-dependent receptor plug domain-containing protein [Acidobacteriota bacterium]